MGIYEAAELRERYEANTMRALVHCRLTSDYVGGQPANRVGVEAYCRHHLGLGGDSPEEIAAREAAVDRILKEEVGEKDATPNGGEIAKKESYGLSVIRRDAAGPWIGDWQIKAAVKAAFSRLGMFQTKGKIGLKGDVAEMGEVRANGPSLNGDPAHVHLVNADGSPAAVGYVRLHGKVHTPQGAVSIVGDHECVAAGTEFHFVLRILGKRATEDDVAKMFACLGVAGIGSARSLQCGRFEVVRLEI